ncbi:hypothetical protein ACFS07_03665 [Undibacterium arcticum]
MQWRVAGQLPFAIALRELAAAVEMGAADTGTVQIELRMQRVFFTMSARSSS